MHFQVSTVIPVVNLYYLRVNELVYEKTKTSDFIRKGLISWGCILYPMQDYFFNLACWKRNKSCQLGVKITKENRCTVAYRRDQQREQGKILGKIH